MKNDIEKVLFTKEELAARVKELASDITKEYKGKNPVILCILKGSLIFTADIVRELDFPCELAFMRVSTYGNGSKSSGKLNIKQDTDTELSGRDIIVAEDILDTGITLSNLIPHLYERGAKSVKLCVLLDKKERRQSDVSADFIGYEIPDGFVVGYGLDYAEKYRNLPYIGILKPEVYEK